MTYPRQNGPTISPEAGGEKRQNSYEESSASKDAENAPDIQQPGAAGDFGTDSGNTKSEPRSAARAPKGTGGRTPEISITKRAETRRRALRMRPSRPILIQGRSRLTVLQLRLRGRRDGTGS